MPSLIVTAVATILAANSLGATKLADKAGRNNNLEQYEVIDLKEEVMNKYYDTLDDSKKNKISYESFEKGYFDSNMSIRDYTTATANGPRMLDGQASQSGGVVYEDARHVISNYRKLNGSGSTPSLNDVLPSFNSSELTRVYDQENDICFSIENGRNPDIPVYYDREQIETVEEKENYIPWCSSLLLPGDIVWDTVRPTFFTPYHYMHTMGVIVNTCKRGYTIENGEQRYFNFVETIEASMSGVRFGFFDDDRILQHGARILRINALQPVRDEVVNFNLMQYGKRFGFDYNEAPYAVPNENRNYWYGAQLVFASYYNCFCDITAVNSAPSNTVVNGMVQKFITPEMIAMGGLTSYVTLDASYENKFIQAVPWPWYYPGHFNLTNPTGEYRLVNYSAQTYMLYDAIPNYRSICRTGIGLTSTGGATIQDDGDPFDTALLWYEEDNAVFMTILRRYEDTWFTAYYRTTANNFVVEDNGNNRYSVTISNNYSASKTYRYSDDLLSYNEATRERRSFDRLITIPAHDSRTVTVHKHRDNQFVSFVQNGNQNEYNAALVRISTGSNFYYSVSPTQMKAPYSTVSSSGEVIYVLDYQDARMESHGNAVWYVFDAYIQIADVIEYDWCSVNNINYIQENNANPFQFACDYDDYSGEFHLILSTFNPFSVGRVRITYDYESSLIFESISFSNYKSTFFVGEEFDCEDLIITAHYANGYAGNYSAHAANVEILSDSYRALLLGVYPIGVKFTLQGKTVIRYYNVTVKDPDIVSVELSGDYQTTFEVGDDFNYDGLEVIALLENGGTIQSTDLLVDDSYVNMNQEGTYPVEVWCDVRGELYILTYEVTVVDNSPTLVSISLSGNYQRVFEVGQNFSYSGLMVRANYSDGSSHLVFGDYTVNASGVDTSVAGSYYVYVNYSENNVNVVARYTVYVVEPIQPATLESISLSGNIKTLFQVGLPFAPKGLIVTANYSDGSSAVVTNYTIDDSDIIISKPGIYTVIVSYTESGVTKTASYDVEYFGRMFPIIGKSIL